MTVRSGDQQPEAVTEARSRNMARIRARDTQPELRVRRALHAAGFRFRLHRRGLPGTPDLVLPRFRTVIFVHGCFWHRHPGCRMTSVPKTRADYWDAKFTANMERDIRVRRQLEEAGWNVIVIWECGTRDAADIVAFVRDRLPAAAPGPVPRNRRTTSATPSDPA
jgi:DNA mismatch endonuclease, patch repair protein